MGTRRSWLLGLLAACFVVSAAAGCNRSIGDIAKNSEQYVGKTVTLKGKVTDTYGIVGLGAYQLTDETGSVWVASSNIPAEGTEKTTTGTLRSGFTLAGKTFGLIVVEE